MAQGAGKYDDIATHVHDETSADTVVLIVLGGDKGSGFSVRTSPEFDHTPLVKVLRQVADKIEREGLTADRLH